MGPSITQPRFGFERGPLGDPMHFVSHLAERIQQAIAVTVLVTLACGSGFSQDAAQYTFHAKSELVLVNVTVRDKNGNPVRDRNRQHFTILEDI